MKTVKSLFILLTIFGGLFMLSGCTEFNLPGNEETPNITDPIETPDPTTEIGGRAPIYQGMVISNVSSAAQTSSASKLLSLNMNSQSEAFDEDIEDVIEEYIDVITSDEIEYFSTRNQDILITVKLFNPDGQSILRFTLNGVIYQAFQFQDGSNSENLILKINSGNVSGIKEFTIDEIKYVENVTNDIKDAIFDGDRTIKLGVEYTNIPNSDISNINITATSFSFNVNITDIDNLIEKSNDILKAVLFDGENIIQMIDLVLGQNEVRFEKLNINQTYQYAVVTVIDKLDGFGSQVLVLHQEYVQTEEILAITDISTTQSVIIFDIVVNDTDEVGAITAIELYKGETLVETLTDLSVREFTGLLSNNEYTIKVTYTYDLNDGVGEQTLVISQAASTVAKATPTIVIDNVVPTQSSISFGITVTDVDQVGTVSAIELYKGETLVETLTDLSVREFTGLLSNNEYTIKVTYTYDLNDGVGEQTLMHELLKPQDTIMTLKTIPDIEILFYHHDMSNVSYELFIDDPDSAMTLSRIYAIVYLKNSGDPMQPIRTEYELTLDFFGSFANLDSGNIHKLNIEYIIDLNDGKGNRIITVTKQFETSKMPISFWSSDSTIAQDSLTFNVLEANEDGANKTDLKFELFNSDKSILISTDFDTQPELLWGWLLEYNHTYNNLLSNNQYILIISYSSDLNDGLGMRYFSHELSLTTSAKATPTLSIDNVVSTQTSILFDITVTDVDQVGAISAIELYKGETLVEELTDLSMRYFIGLLSNNEYTIKVTYAYDLNDGVGSQTLTINQQATTVAKATPTVAIDNVVPTQTSIGFGITVTDLDQVGTVSAIELYKGETLEEALTDLSVREFTGLLSNNEYTIKVTYTYDLNDGVGVILLLDSALFATFPTSISFNDYQILNSGLIGVGVEVQLKLFMTNPDSVNISSVILNQEIYDIEFMTIDYLIVKFTPDTSGGIFNVQISGIIFESAIGGLELLNVSNYSFDLPILGELHVQKMYSNVDNIIYKNVNNFLYIIVENPNDYNVNNLSIQFGDQYSSMSVYSFLIDEIEMINSNTIKIPWPINEINFYEFVSIKNITYGLDEFNTVTKSFMYKAYEFIVLESNEINSISTVQQLLNIQDGYIYQIVNDIDLKDINWIPMDFQGVIYGNNYSLLNLVIINNDQSSDILNIGLFGNFNGLVKDLTVSSAYISINNVAQNNIGIYAGQSNTYFKANNLIVSGYISSNTTSTSHIGGIVGKIKLGYFDGFVSTVSFNITASERVYLGGVVGYTDYWTLRPIYFENGVISLTLDLTTTGDWAIVGGILGSIGGQFEAYVHFVNNTINSNTTIVGASTNVAFGGIVGYYAYASAYISNNDVTLFLNEYDGSYYGFNYLVGINENGTLIEDSNNLLE